MATGSQSQNLQLRQSQSLVMTPQLQQALKLLQFSSQELAVFIEEALQSNPLLMREEQQSDAKQADEETRSDTAKEPDAAQESADTYEHSEEFSTLERNNEALDQSDVSFENVWGGKDAGGQGSGFDGRQGDTPGFEQTYVKDISLQDHVLEQVNIDISDPVRRIIAVHLVDLLDDTGYFTGDMAALAELLECEETLVEEVLLELQHCDPPGIFARSLSECLALQLKDKNRYDPAMQSLLEHLDLMAQGDFSELMHLCGVGEEDIRQMCTEIRALDPKPGRHFSTEIVETVHIDVFVRKKNDGSWAIELNNEALPKLLVNNKYYADVKTQTKNEHEKRYITEQMQHANWLVKALNQRAETILKVSTELVSQQSEFFEKGIYYLRPLTLNDIAEGVDMHESTVARVTANKYISTPKGLYAMKFFFSSSLKSTEEGEANHSSKTVKHLIQEIVDNEPETKTLSDDKISNLLKEKGIDIARRTVMKYREAMNIPSSVERRRQKKMGG